jgi:hypothetical protein
VHDAGVVEETFSLPNFFSAAATMFSAVAAFETSAFTAIAFWIMPTVSCAAFSFTSTATTAAPSREKSSAVWRPMPLPAPVMSATLSLSLISSRSIVFRSQSVPACRSAAPRCGRSANSARYIAPKACLGEFALSNASDGLRQRVRHPLQSCVRVGVADEAFGGSILLLDAVQA